MGALSSGITNSANDRDEIKKSDVPNIRPVSYKTSLRQEFAFEFIAGFSDQTKILESAGAMLEGKDPLEGWRSIKLDLQS